MLSFIGRRKILRLYKARAINKTVIKPSRDAKFCVSQTSIPQTDALQYITFNHAFIPRETQNFASHKQSFRTLTRYNIPHISMLLSLGRRKILRLYKAHAITIKGDMEPEMRHNITFMRVCCPEDAIFCVSTGCADRTSGRHPLSSAPACALSA